jgi:Predicted periplasmic protein (DUF2092)
MTIVSRCRFIFRVVLTDVTDEARPQFTQFTAIYTWNLAHSINDGAFSLDPPPGALRVPLGENPRGGGS